MKKTKKFLIVTIFVFVFATIVQAANWSAAGTFSIPARSGWYRFTTAGTMLSAVKDSDSTKYDVDTYERTAWNAPVFRLVNSDNVERSDHVACAPEGERATGSNNQGSIGYRYYASVRSSNFQMRTDTIKLDFTPR